MRGTVIQTGKLVLSYPDLRPQILGKSFCKKPLMPGYSIQAMIVAAKACV